jgi:UDP-3-O-[3-hydroxymyristoyl] glucosamine N-acyltransferase
VGKGSSVGVNSDIRAGVSIGENVTIGSECVLHPNVVIYDNVTIGDRVILHAGVVIGADGFGYVRGDMGYHNSPKSVRVIIEDDVELGANSTVDRRALGRTRIGKGTSSTTWSRGPQL